jgi:DNA-binding CsgD family transcriptional regulator
MLRGQLEEGLAGSGNIVVLSGEAGIGKSRLAGAICREAGDAGALVLTGYCYDSAVTPPYGPFVEILEQYASLRSQHPERFPAPLPPLTQGTSYSALFGELRDFFLTLARDRPLAILMEDVHWADAESFELLRFIARQLARAPVLLVITYRNDEVTRGHPLHRLVPMLVREALAVRIDVSPLSDESVRALIEQTYQLPAEATSRLADHLQQRAEGNPFFVTELLRSLEGTMLLQSEDGSWTLGPIEQTRIPSLLRQVIDQRLSRLGSEAETLLSVAAIIGEVVPLGVWETVSGTTGAMLLDLLERSIEANILNATPDGAAARFTHALIRESLYESVSPPRRRAWHLRIGESLAEIGSSADPDEVAYHLSQAGDQRAAEWLTRAGERAQRALAWRTARQRFEEALTLLEGDQTAPGARGWLRFRLALLGRFEDPGAGVTMLEEAERLARTANDRALVAYARFYQGMLRCQGDDLRRGIAAEEAGIALLDALSPGDRERLLAIETTSDPLDAQNGRGELTLALAENGRLGQALELGERIVALPPEDTFGSRGDAWYGLGYACAALGRPDAATRAFRSARQTFAANDYRGMVTASLFDELTMVVVPFRLDQPAERVRLETELEQSLAALAGISDSRSARCAYVFSMVLSGEWEGIFELLDQSGLRFMRRNIPMLLAPIARLQGNAGLAWELIQQAFPSGSVGDPEDAVLDAMPLRAVAIALALDANDLVGARRWLESFDTWLAWSGSVLGCADAQLAWAGYERSIGDHAASRMRAEQALTAAEAPRQPIVLLAAHRFLGECDLTDGQIDPAEAHLTEALALAVATESAHERALTLIVQAELRLRQGRAAAARALLETARALCEPMNAALTLARIERLDARLPGAPSVASTPHPAGLTPREADVLRLLATGLPNAEIAERLNLSSRTIDTHLTSIYGKLGVTSRGAAIRFALDHGLS